ncbi:hypothetical protein BK809_0007632 [Diplodia seriata]|uniref:Xylanolytic transcriptional activator regulatory domain-containing protein n=1 Tax=Diplodia seriata TaxID=420778 RepID=A0A1S8BJC7_9PEZI|nr:hypothetical protein BK809_0007632 [Diplodia seriata]
MSGVLVGTPDHSQFHRHSLKFLDDAIAECADEPPSLCLVQVLIVITFNQLIQGVRGRAWRSLGLCVRMAYELGLHEVDSGEPYRQAPEGTHRLTRWCFDEERRRAWWAIWEMDAFASTIRRCPLAIDWTEVETYLPVLDNFWFERRYHRSCFLKAKPIDRVRALRESKNESPAAWLVVVISLMREAHLLSKPKGLRNEPYNDIEGKPGQFAAHSNQNKSADVSERLAIISHALHCYSLSLPKGLRYRHEHLSFEPAHRTRAHSSIFNINCTAHLATLMLYHNHLGPKLKQQFGQGHTTDDTSNTDTQGLRECIEASDGIFTIIKNSAPEHVRHVNPFLSSTVWFAAAVQLAHRFIAPSGTNTELVESKVELLRMNCQQYADFWSTPDALLENLSILEFHLESQLGQDQLASGNPARHFRGEDGAGQQSGGWGRQVDVSLLSPDPMIPSGFHHDTTATNTTNPSESEDCYYYGGQAGTVDGALADFSMENVGMELDFALDTGEASLCLDDLLFDSHAA